MPTPAKPANVLRFENKAHKSNEELNAREAAENALLTGKRMKVRPEVKADPIAYKEYKRIAGLLKIIQKDDALYEGAVNRLAQLYSEILNAEAQRAKLDEAMSMLLIEYKEKRIDYDKYFKLLDTLEKKFTNLDIAIMAKRKMLLDLEKESILTVAAALRTIPKTVKKKIEDPNSDLFD
jgi:hypothetical protein